MKALKVIRKIAGIILASIAFVLLCGEGCRYEVSWFWSGCWIVCLFAGAWLLGLQNIKPIREKFAELDAEMAKAREEE